MNNKKLLTIRNHITTALKWGIYLAPIAFYALDAHSAGFDFDKAKEATIDPLEKFINSTYKTGIFISGLVGLFLNRQGDLYDKAAGFGKGILAGGLIVAAAKAGLSMV